MTGNSNVALSLVFLSLFGAQSSAQETSTNPERSLEKRWTTSVTSSNGKYDFAALASNSTCLTYLGSGGGTFAQQPTLQTGTQGSLYADHSMVVGDFNGDNKPDLAICDQGSTTISVYLGKGDGTFGARSAYTVGTNPVAIALLDYNHDGQLDLAVANRGTNNVSVLKGNGLGVFTLAQTISVGTGPFGIATADLNRDGYVDIVTANFTSRNISILYGSSTGVFSVTSNVSTGVSSTGSEGFLSIALADIDGNGYFDIAVASMSDSSVYVFRNSSIGVTADSVTRYFNGIYAPVSLALGDFDGKNGQDLAVANNSTNSAIIRLNSGSGTFLTPQTVILPNVPNAIYSADLDGDGDLDLIVSSYSGTVCALINSNGTFSLSQTTTTSANLLGLGIGDFNGDRSDIPSGQLGIDDNRPLDNTFGFSGGVTGLGWFNQLTPATYPATIERVKAYLGSSATSGTLLRLVVYLDPENDGPENGQSPVLSQSVSVTRDADNWSTFTLSSPVTISSGSFVIGFIDNLSTGLAYPATWNVPGLSSPPGSRSFESTDNGSTFMSEFSRAYPKYYSSFLIRGVLRTATAPTITSFSPTSGPVGATVTISGTNFSTTPSSNIVYFGAVRATVSFVSSTSLTVTVPVGATYAPITVTDTVAHLTAYSSRPFNVTFAGSSGISASLLAPKVDLSAGNSPYYISAGDIDGDGKVDLVLPAASLMSIYRNTSTIGAITTNSFASPINLALGSVGQGVALGDLDGEGKLDIVTVTGNTTLSVFRNKSTPGTISFDTPLDFPATAGCTAVAIGDVDGDGKPDVIVANYNGGSGTTVSVFRNTSIGTNISFAARVEFACGTAPIDVAIGDMDGDGKPDLVVANHLSANISILRNLSSAGVINSSSFSAATNFSASGKPISVALADLDGDGKLDVAQASLLNNAVSVYRNSSSVGAIALQAKVDYPTLDNPRMVVVSDLDGNGKPDLVITDATNNKIALFQNLATAGTIIGSSFGSRIEFLAGTLPFGLVCADIDADGKPDIAVTNNTSNSISVFRYTNQNSETEPNNTATQANLMVYGDSLNASINPSGDVDYYKFNASAGDTVEIYSYDINGSLLDGMIAVFDAAGNSLGRNDDFLATSSSRIITPIPSNGTYYVRYSYFAGSVIFPNGTLLSKAARENAETATEPHGKKSSTVLDVTGDYRLRIRRFVPTTPLITSLFFPTNVYSNSAWIIGAVYPNGSPTTVKIEYGLTAAYGQLSSGVSVDGLSSYDVTVTLSGLSPGSTYHARIVATNSKGSVVSSDRTFNTPPSSQAWSRLSTGTSEDLYAVCFSDAQNGTAVGTNGIVIHTTNGGTTWTNQSSGVANDLLSVFFVGTNFGSVVGVGGTILRTTNGGVVWTQQTSGTTYGLRGVYFTDSNTGTAVGSGGTILRTTNGGVTWIGQSSGTTNDLFDVSFTSSTTGTVVGSGGMILRTTNSGASWIAQSSGITDVIRQVVFTDANTGTAVGYNGRILRTSNGGTTWTAQTSGTAEYFYGLALSDVNTGVVAGSSGIVLRTTNGGATWTSEPSGTLNYIYGISYANNTVNAVGDYGMFLRSGSAMKSEIEPNNTASQATFMVYGDSLNASINPSGDVDYYRFNASAGDTIDVYAFDINSSLLSSQILLYDSYGNQLVSSYTYTQGTDSRFPYAFSSGGTYYLRVSESSSTGSFPNSAPRSNQPAEEQRRVKQKKTSILFDPTGDYRIRLSRYVTAAPFATIGYVSRIFSDLVLVNAYAIPNGLPTTISLQYGLTTSYGSTATWGTTGSGDIGYWSYPINLSGLSPNTIYHYRVVATNSKGTSYSQDDSFTTAAAPQGWSRQVTGTEELLLGVCFTDGQTGTAVGTNGTIIRTTNGGTTWSNQTSGTTNLLWVASYVNTNVGTIVGSGGTILRTTNAGATWTQQTSGTANNLRGVYFTDANTGTVIGIAGTILRTTNGGATWSSQSSGTTNNLYGISFVNTNVGTVVGVGGTILRTTNGGTTWIQQTSGTVNNLRGVYFTDANTGTVVGYPGTILRTTNGGATWTTQTSGTSEDLYGVAFSDINTGVAVGSTGTVLRTTNGGATWTSESSGTLNYIYCVSYANNTFNVVGDYGVSLRSTLAGAPVISVSSFSLSLGSINVGTSSQQSLNISNTGNASLSVSSISSNNSAFTVNPTSFSVSAGGSQTVIVTFTPSAVGTYSGSITINHNASGSPTTVSVTGTGVATPTPSIVVSASSIAFGTVNTGSSSQRTFTVSNSGTATLNVTNITSSDAAFSVNPTSFSISSGGGAQTVTVTFTPTASRSYSATLSVTHNASGSPSQISLTGTGTGAAAITLASSSISLGTVNIGSSTSQTLDVTNSGTITLTVTSLTSSNSSFAANPTSFTVSPGVAQTITITFAPSVGGAQSSTFTFASNVATNPTFTASGVGETRLPGSSTQVGRFSGGIPPSSWVLMSIPYRLDNTAASTLASQLSGDAPWKLYTYENGQNVDITNAADAFTIARGFWFKTTAKSSSFNLSFGAGQLVEGSSYQKLVPTGWYLVGPPFNDNEASWKPINTSPGSPGVRVYKYAHETSKWQLLDPAVERMKPYGGYAIYNATGSSATLEFDRNGPLSSIQEWQPGDGWYGVLAIGDTRLRFGQHKLASAGEDGLDYPMPPARPEADVQDPYISEKLWSDIKPIAENAVTRWNVTVDPRTGGWLKLQELVGLPEGWEIMVDDIPGFGALKLREGEEIHLSKSIPSPVVMTVLVGPAELVAKEASPTQFVLYQNYPNPFNPSTTIRYGLATESRVSVRVYDILGIQVYNLVQENQKPGYYTVRWEGCDEKGLAVTSGIYFLRVTVGSRSEVRKMVLVR